MVGMVGTGKIVAMPAARDEAAESAINRLEEALETARENPCVAVSIFLIHRDGDMTLVDAMESRTQLIGALELMKYQAMVD